MKLLLSAFLAVALYSLVLPWTHAAAEVSPVPAPSLTPMPLSPVEGKQLQKEYLKAQKTELDAMDHRQDLELQQLRSSQKANYKEWMEKEKGLRHQFFAEHLTGVEKREYMRAFASRRDSFLKAQSDDYSNRKKENKDHLAQLKKTHELLLKEFQGSLSRGERPASSLWPQ